MLASFWNRKTLILAMMQLKVGCIVDLDPWGLRLDYVSNFWLCKLSSNIGEYVDMVRAGIIDQLKVIRTALMDAARSSL